MPRVKRKQYTAEFKEEAVRMLEADPRSIREVADELGVNPTLLQKWRKKLGRAPVPFASVSALTKDESVELTRLRKRVAVLEEEREILKKATAFFARENK